MQIKNLKTNFNTTEITAVIDVWKNNIDFVFCQSLSKKYDLLIKPNFHITIIGSSTGKKILELIANFWENEKEVIISRIRNLFIQTKWSIELVEEFYYIEKYYHEEWLPEEKRESIIQLAIIKELEQFYSELNNILDTEFYLPIQHVTLLTNSTREDKKSRWIWIYCKKDFDNFNPKRIK